jgi:hypothetical protein
MSTPGYESRLAFGNTADFETSSTWTEFSAVIELEPPTLEADDIETSNMLTPGQVKTWAPGWADSGEISATLEFAAADVKNLYTKFRVPLSWKLSFNDAPEGEDSTPSHLLANGYIKSIGAEVDREGLVTVPVVIKVSGATEFVEAAAGD